MKEILKELKNINKTLSSIRTFIIANDQLIKSLLDEIKSIKLKMRLKK